jgi:5-oxoprolinase (ATP-hydrolysing)/N-methylhydantoinase A
VLEFQRERRFDLYDVFIEKPKPVIPRHYIWEVNERMAFDGTVIKEMDEEEVRSIVTALIQKGIRSVVVSLLHSYVNPSHEKRIGEIVREMSQDIMISLSHEVIPHIGEYERVCTAAINAYVMPETRVYLEKLVTGLSKMGFSEDIYIMKSNGGITTVDNMIHFPVHMIEAGPAAGVLMAAFYGNYIFESQNMVSFDMGGTTAKLALIEDGRPRVTNYFEADKVKLKEGSGLPIIVPAVDLIEIGAGGGSIASVKMGVIAVGPESAGAEPGPVCYGSGGQEPTVTDANLLLGYLSPDYFLGGRIKLDKEAAYRSIEEKIAKPLGLDVTQAAWGIHETVNKNMAAATRVVSIQRGRDPRRLPFVVFGGAGPAHGSRIARELGISKVFIPIGAGVTSAIGLLVAGLSFDFNRPHMATVSPEVLQFANRMFSEMRAEGEAVLKKARAKGDYSFFRTADMRYVGQGEHFNVSIPDGTLDDRALEEIKRRFNALYFDIFGYSDENQPIEVVNWRLTAYCPPPPVKMKKYEHGGGDLDDAVKGKREVYFPETEGFVDCPVYDRYDLFDGAVIEGPAVIEERESTTLILPGDCAHVDEYCNLMIEIQEIKKGGELTISEVDPITLGVVWGALTSITEEIGAALKKTAYSLAVREGNDFSVGLFNEKGLMVAQGDFTPGHLGAMPFVVKHVLSEHPAEEMKPGDVVLLNDPYMGSGHLPDFFCLAPIFHQNQLVAFAVNCAHQVDVGGALPGSQAIENVYDVFSEGVRITPIKIYKAGKLQEDIVKLILGNVRIPDIVGGDLMAQANAIRVGERRVSEFFTTYGASAVKECMDEIITRSEEATREEIRKMPDGTYSFTDYFDDYGRDTEPITVHVEVTIDGSDMVFDFTGSSPQVPAGFNSVLNYTYSYCFYAAKCFTTDPRIPQNEGTIRPVKVVAPEGSFFNPKFPAPVAGRAIINQRIADVVNGALSKIVPEKAVAAACSWANPNFGGFNPRTGKNFVSYEIAVGGFGARSNKDGCEGMVSAFNISNVPVEIFETKVPLFVERFEIVQDSAGVGRYRGGHGIRRDVRILEDSIHFSNLTDRHRFAGFGLFGGKPGTKGMTILNPGPHQKVLHSKGSYTLKAGDVVSQILNGPGGYGDPLERDPAAARNDVIGEYVSLEQARKEYGVVIDPETVEVNEEETAELRTQLKRKGTR